MYKHEIHIQNRYQNAFRASTLRWKGVPLLNIFQLKKRSFVTLAPFFSPAFIPFRDSFFFQSLRLQTTFPHFSNAPFYFWLFTFFFFLHSSGYFLLQVISSSFFLILFSSLFFAVFSSNLLRHFSKELETPISHHFPF